LPGDTTYESLFQLNYATDWAGFKQALSYHVAPNLNMLYSDTQGNIGYTAAGKIPIRSNGDGSTISAGGGTDNIWTGFIPVDELPQSFNPVKGYIVSANNKIIDDSYGYFISNDWALPARAERIEQLLDQAIEAQQPINIDTMAKMQLDSIDRSALPLIELLQHYQATSPRQKEVLVLLTGWNASMAGDSIAATVFTVWMKHLKQTLFERSVTDYWNSDINIPAVINRLSEDTNNQQIERMLTDDSGLWCAALSHCNAELSTALDSAIGEMDKYAGSNTDNWAWGQFQSAVFEHIPFSFVNILDQIFERRISNGGSANTINVSSSTFELSKGYEQKFGTALRQIIQPANPLAEVFYINTTGQSGNVLSPHYDDSIVSFNQGKLRRLAEPLSTGAVTTLQPKEK
jgi:penicillin amidase